MFAQFSVLRRSAARAAIASMMLVLVAPLSAEAAGNARYELHPHCEGNDELKNVFGGPFPNVDFFTKLTEGTCRSFEVRDPQSRQTSALKTGDVIEMDLVLHNPDKKPISRYRAWVAYDASVLEGMNVELSPRFPTPTPGENTFSSSEGYLKLSGTADSPISDESILIARIKMKVLTPRSEGTPITFFDVSDTSESKTGAFQKDGSQESSVLATNPGYLYVRFADFSGGSTGGDGGNTVGGNGGATAGGGTTGDTGGSTAGSTAGSSGGSTAGGTTSQASSASQTSSKTTITPSTVFTMLQVQGLRVTTEGSSVFLAWDALPSSELVGYNVYYGTTSGRYIQRRGVDKDATTLTLRALPVGVTYYFAVRGVNAENQETEFSQEVGISVGNPATSTSPLVGSTRPTPTPGTNGSVAGDTGVSSTLLILLFVSAVTGTFVAFRRQWSVSPEYITHE